MSPSQPNAEQPVIDVYQLARAIRFAFVAFVLAVSYFSVRGCLAIESFRHVFADMLGNHPLPAITVFAFQMRLVFSAIGILTPVVAIGALFSRRVVGSFYVLGVLCLVALVESVFLWNALSAPLFQIITSMGGNP